MASDPFSSLRGRAPLSYEPEDLIGSFFAGLFFIAVCSFAWWYALTGDLMLLRWIAWPVAFFTSFPAITSIIYLPYTLLLFIIPPDTEAESIKEECRAIKKSIDERLIDECSKGNIDELRALLSEGADVNAIQQYSPYSALIAAVHGNHSEICKLLLVYGADPELKSGTSTPIEYAANRGFCDILEILLDAAPCPRRSRPMGWAANTNQAECIYLLCDSGFNPDEKLGNGYTPLCSAIHKNNVDAAIALIACGASVNTKTPDGLTPLELARRINSHDLISRLRNEGAI